LQYFNRQGLLKRSTWKWILNTVLDKIFHTKIFDTDED